MMAGTGLVICGGKSSRMGTDKSRIVYHGQPQSYHMASLLQPFCTEVWLSVNEQQESFYKTQEKYQVLLDLPAYAGKGPMAALLTAGTLLPGKPLWVAGCDYPLLQQQELAAFACTLQAQPFAAAFYNEAAGRYEPLLAYYSGEAIQQLLVEAEDYQYSLQRFLRSHNAIRYIPLDKDSILSVDDPVTAAEVRARITKEK